jgi:acyl-CoA synthetase (AMP-forming)/AMP-acid ligase II
MMSGNRAEFLCLYFALAKVGAIAVPVNLMWKQGELAYVLSHSDARTVVTEARFAPAIESVRDRLPSLQSVFVIPEVDAESGAYPTFDRLAASGVESEPECFVEDRDPVSYLYTSGTTSAPKGVVSSHLAIYMGALSMALDSGLSGQDRVLAMLPLFHTSPLNTHCTPAIAAGAGIVIRNGFEAGPVLQLFERERITTLLALPLMYRQLLETQLESPRDVGSLRLALYGMAPMPEHELRRLIDVFGCEFMQLFGQTEMSPVTSMLGPEWQLSRPAAVGTPATNVQIAIMAEDGRLLAPGDSGEIVYRGPQVLNGYLKNDAATRDAFRHGWFHSGDVGHFDADGVLWFSDRIKDVIKSGGENVASVEVEQALYDAEPGILEVVVIGLPHPHWGEAVTAIVVPRPGQSIDPAELLRRARERLSPFKSPKDVILVDGMPKTATNKVQKGELRARFAEHYSRDLS